jgi:hypothetical protein
VKRSRAVQLVLLASAAATLEGCARKQCVDENGTVVDVGYCQGTLPPQPLHGYRWYTSFVGYRPLGSNIREEGTIRGIFGGAGEGVHGGESGAGE